MATSAHIITPYEFSGWMSQLIEPAENAKNVENAKTAHGFALSTLLPNKIPHKTPSKIKFAVAVSGGADSMALLLLTNDFALQKNYEITAITINHNLRSEAIAEAKQVAQWCDEKNIKHHIINWDFPKKPTSAIQETARNARYQLLADFCEKNNIKNLLTAHHGDDQIETFFFRLARGSGLLGLAGMSAKTEIYGVNLLRPLLRAPKARLIATLEAKNQAWIEDPSNQNMGYTRVRIRHNLRDFLSCEENQKHTMELINKFGKFRMAMEKHIAFELTDLVAFLPNGYATLDMQKKISEPALAHLIKILSGKEQAPRTKKMQRFYQKLYEKSGKKQSFSGLLFKPSKDNKIIIYPEKETAKNAKFSAKMLAASGFWSMNNVNNFGE